MSTPYPGSGSLKRGVQSCCLSIKLHEPDHTWVSTGVKEECSNCLSISMQDCHDVVLKDRVGGKHCTHALEGDSQVRLEGWALSRE